MHRNVNGRLKFGNERATRQHERGSWFSNSKACCNTVCACNVLGSRECTRLYDSFMWLMKRACHWRPCENSTYKVPTGTGVSGVKGGGGGLA